MIAPANDKEHNSEKKIAELVIQGKLMGLAVGTIAMLEINHEEQCDIRKGGTCDCDPEIKFNGKVVE